MKPGSCTLPLYGIDTVVLDPVTGKIIEGNDVEGVLALRSPWPGIARTCLGDHDRYLTTYFRPYPGYYFTGDAVRRDKDGYYFITGRVDDVLNVSGKLCLVHLLMFGYLALIFLHYLLYMTDRPSHWYG